MTDKMREAIIQFGQDNPSLDLDFRLHTHGKYLTQEKAIVASRAFKAGAAWQAAQAEQYVPVVGEVVAYRWATEDNEWRVTAWSPHTIKLPHSNFTELIERPTTSITEAELERLRKDAERYRWLREQKGLHLASDCMVWTRKDLTTFVSSHRLASGDTAFAPAETLDETIDAAIAAEGEKE